MRPIEQRISLREAHRCLKIWRAMWKVAAALGYCVRDADPSLGVRNRAAPARKYEWSEGEIVRLAKRAWRMKYHGLAAVIAVAWGTQLSPGDVRSLRASQMVLASAGEAFFTERGKTGKPVGDVLSLRSIRVLTAYLEKLGVELHGDAHIFRNRSGAPYSSDTLGEISATFASLSLAHSIAPPSGMISAAAARARRSRAGSRWRNWRTRWATRSRHRTHCSRPIAR
jgi:hypothetical protein